MKKITTKITVLIMTAIMTLTLIPALVWAGEGEYTDTFINEAEEWAEAGIPAVQAETTEENTAEDESSEAGPAEEAPTEDSLAADQESEYIVEVSGESGTFHYTSIQTALDQAEDGDEFKVLKDIEVKSPIVLNKAINLTLDLNGHVIRLAEASSDENGYIRIEKGYLTIKDSSEKQEGAIESANSTKPAIIFANGEDEAAGITIESGNFINYEDMDFIALQKMPEEDEEIEIPENVELQVQGGTFSAELPEAFIAEDYAQKEDEAGNWTVSRVDIEEIVENIVEEPEEVIVGSESENLEETVEGEEPVEGEETAEGAEAEEGGEPAEEATEAETEQAYVVQVSGVSGVYDYYSLQTALDQAEDGDAFLLTGDVSLMSALTFDKDISITFDLNGHVIKLLGVAEAHGGSLRINYGYVTLKDSSAEEKGFIEDLNSAVAPIAVSEYAVLGIEGGNFNFDIPQELIAEGFVVKDMGEGIFRVEELPEEETEEVTEAPTEETTEEATEAPTEETTEEATEAPTEEVTEEETKAPTEETTEEATEVPTEEVTEEATEAPMEETTEEVTEAPTEEETEPVILAIVDGVQGEYEYYSVQNAIDQADDGDYITIINDVTLREPLVFGVDRELTFDLNGHVIMLKGIEGEEGGALRFQAGRVYLCDGSEEGSGYIENSNSQTVPLTVADGAELIIVSGRYNFEIPGTNVADGFAAVEYDDGNWAVVAKSEVPTEMESETTIIEPATEAVPETESETQPEAVPETQAEAQTEPATMASYTITWQNWDGSWLYECIVEEGQIPEYKGETPVKAEDEENTYTFAGWGEVKPAEEDATYVAKYDAAAKVKTYTIVWLNWDGTSLGRSSVEEGQIPEYTGGTPEKPADDKKTYTFSGWGEIAPADRNMTYIAEFASEPINYQLTWSTDGGSIDAASQYTAGGPVNAGKTVIAPKVNKEGYQFEGWYKDAEFTQPWAFDTDTVMQDTTIYAKWREIPTTTTAPESTEAPATEVTSAEAAVISETIIESSEVQELSSEAAAVETTEEPTAPSEPESETEEWQPPTREQSVIEHTTSRVESSTTARPQPTTTNKEAQTVNQPTSPAHQTTGRAAHNSIITVIIIIVIIVLAICAVIVIMVSRRGRRRR